MTEADQSGAPGARVWLAFLALSLIWGSSYLFIRIGVRHLTPPALVTGRVLVGTLVLSAVVLARHHSIRVDRRTLLLLVAIASVNTAIPFLLIAWGETTVTSGLASVLNSTVPIFTVLLAGVLLHDEQITRARIGGVALGFAGVLVLLSRDLHLTGLWSHLAGQVAILLSSVCYAVSAVATRRTLRGVPAMTIAFHVLWISTVQTLVVTLVAGRPDLAAMHRDTIFAVLWLGALGSGIAYLLAYFILEHWGAARYTLVAYMLPVTGLTLGAIVLHEALDVRIVAGSVMVVLGVVLASLVSRSRAVPEAVEVQETEPPAPALG